MTRYYKVYVLTTCSVFITCTLDFFFQVIVMVVFVAVMTFAKVSIATVFRIEGRKALLWCGIITQAGSAVGAIILFILINILELFQSKYPCT